MAEHRTSTATSAEMTQRFLEFVLFQTQNASMFLGRMPNPQTGQPEVNLDIARMFIDQLEMIAEKTKGNLTNDESSVLNNALTNLRMAFVEVSAKTAPASPSQPQHQEPASGQAPHENAADEPEEGAGAKKKFTKSYGA